MWPEELENQLGDVAAPIGTVPEGPPGNRLGWQIADKIVRSGTSPAPNDSEGCAAESRRDFAHALRIGRNELRTMKMWLRIM